MTADVSDMPPSEWPLSEQFRVVAKAYEKADAAASLMEELKTTTLEKRKNDLIASDAKLPDSHAERIVKASEEWADYIKQMCALRAEANLKKLKVEYIRMKFTENQSSEANARRERAMYR